MQADNERPICRRSWRSAGHATWAVVTVGILLVGPSAAPHARAACQAPASFQLAEAEEDEFGNEVLPSERHGGSRSPKGLTNKKTTLHGYDSQRIKRFWSHYHAARPESKSHKKHGGSKSKARR